MGPESVTNQIMRIKEQFRWSRVTAAGLNSGRMMNTRFAFRLALALGLVIGIAGCATKKPAKSNYLFFPPAPDQPRIQYLTSFGAESDLRTSSKFTQFVAGEEKVVRPIWKPYGVTIKHGKVYVCDTQMGAVVIADLQKGKFTLLKPEGQAALRLPVNVAVDEKENCYITDILRGQVLIYDKQGNLLDAIGKTGELKPSGIVLSGDRIYVTEMKKSVVAVFGRTDHKFLFSFPNNPTNEHARLFQPTNLAADSKGRIYVSDSGGFATKIFDSEGNHVRTVGELGVTPGQFSLPKGVGVDRDGRFYVVDAAAPVVQLFDADGRLLMFFGQPGSSGQAGLYLPAGLTVDYENTGLFQKYVAPGYKIEYLILLTNQVGPQKVSVFGFLTKA
jgi:DNA-binding beta-propeller fold protein YncE